MRLPDFTQDEGLNRLKEQMGIPRDQYGSAPAETVPPTNTVPAERDSAHRPDGAPADAPARDERRQGLHPTGGTGVAAPPRLSWSQAAGRQPGWAGRRLRGAGRCSRRDRLPGLDMLSTSCNPCGAGAVTAPTGNDGNDGT